MFGFFVSEKIRNVATSLKTLGELSLENYSELSKSETKEKIERDFDKEYRNTESGTYLFVYKSHPSFKFTLDEQISGEGGMNLVIMGSRDFAGFMMHYDYGWKCTTMSSAFQAATSDARSLVKVLSKEHGVEDMSKFIS